MTRQRNLREKQNVQLYYIFGITGNDHQQQFLVLQRAHLGLKYNIGTTKQQGTIEDRSRSGRPRKLAINDNKALSQWIQP